MTRSESPGLCAGLGPRGGRCKRRPGAGTTHPGEGLCSSHDETVAPLSLAENETARELLLAFVRDTPGATLRLAAEHAGYHRRDAKQLLAADEEFRDLYREARGYDDDAIRQQIRKRAFDATNPSDRLLLELARAQVPEYQEAHRIRFEGRLDVRGVPYVDLSKLTDAELETYIALTRKAQPDPGELPRDGRPALEIIEGGMRELEAG